MNIKAVALPTIQRIFREKGYAFFENGNFNLNIIGVRTKGRTAGLFDDWIVVIYKNYEGQWVLQYWPITTDAGTYWLKNPMNKKGTALLVPNQYRKAFKLGYHKGEYAALVQNIPLPVYRDNDRDTIIEFDEKSIDFGMFGINIHRSNPQTESKVNEKWSAGCQVFSNPKNFDQFMHVCKIASQLWGDEFSYTLLKEEDFGNL